jgi:ribose 1,5-bisphosphokinase
VSSEAALPHAGAEEPGTLVLVVGPSGAGKDSLLGLARLRLADEPGVVFARRVVTRASSASEEHDTMTPGDFARARDSNAFCLSWSANDLDYGLRTELRDSLREGCVVVANGSRAIVGEARRRFDRVVSVLVTAPPDVLARRLEGRERADNVQDRLVRARTVTMDVPADAVIENVGSRDEGAERLVGIIRAVLTRQGTRAPALAGEQP